MVKLYAQMSRADMLAWGQAEREARIADLANARISASYLSVAQAAAKARRKLIQATLSEASAMVSMAGRHARRGLL